MNSPCPLCGEQNEALLSGMPCRACMSAALSEPTKVGEYELLDPDEPIGEGSSSVVYRACHCESGAVVALKLAKEHVPEALFRRQAQLESALHHAHVVGVQAFGTHAGRPFLVMQLMEGGTLAKHPVQRAPFEVRLATALKIVRAVQHAHELGILHCDLKPENVLFDRADEPMVSDFGVARALDVGSDGFVVGGTPGWMSPEQTRAVQPARDADPKPLTTASDVFALGILLHWLVTGEQPFGHGEDAVRCVLAEDPPALGDAPFDVGWGMRAIARRAMQKEPSARYPSAAALAEDLERLRDGRALLGVSAPFRRRAARWCRNFPVRAALSAALVSFALVMTVRVIWIVRELEALHQRDLVESTQVTAGLGARATLLHFIELARSVSEAAERQDLRDALSLSDSVRRESALLMVCKEILRNYDRRAGDQADGAPYRFWGIFDAGGRALAHTMVDYPFVGQDFQGRDYVVGARALGETGLHQAYLSHVFIGTPTNEYEFLIAAPVFTNDGTFAGILTASVLTTADLGTVPLEDSRYTAVLAGPEDPSSGPLVPPILPPAVVPAFPPYRIFRHPKLEQGASFALRNEELRRAATASSHDRIFSWQEPGKDDGRARVLNDYRDPLGEKFAEYGGNRLAAFAPVGRTGYVFIVQANERDAPSYETRFARRVLESAALVASPGVLLILAAFAYGRVRDSKRSRPSRDPLPAGGPVQPTTGELLL